MSSDTFEKLYRQVRPVAVGIIARKFRDSDLAEEAVQQAALYFLEHTERYREITRSLFIQKAVNQARDLLKARGRRAKRELPVGGQNELAKMELGRVQREIGRKVPDRGADPPYRNDSN